jgi:Lar family restriction alleviation protein
MTDKLKHCPFCGSPNVSAYKNDSTGWWYVFCNGCGAEGSADLGESGAIAAWNQRNPVWIPIEDRLPTIEETYNDDALFVWNGKMVRACYNPYETMKNGVEPLSFYTQDENGYDYQLDFVTHWMAVEPPAEAGEENNNEP